MKYYLLFLLLAARLFAAFAPPATPSDLLAGRDATKPVTSNVLTSYVGSALSLQDGYLWSDGATANRVQVQTPGSRGNMAGAALASWVGWVDVPTSNPANDAIIACIQGGIAYPWAAGNSLAIFLGPFGKLEISQWSSVSDSRTFAWPNVFRSTYSGQRVWLEVRITAGTSTPVVRVNGVDISSNFSTGSFGTPAAWLHTGLTSSHHLTGYIWPTGVAPLGCWLNAHLTDAESEAWRITGRPPAWVVAGGSQVSGVATSRSYSVGAADANNTTDTTSSSTTVSAVSGARTGGAGAFFLRIAQNATTAGRAGGLSNVLGIATPSRVSVRFWARTTTGITGPGINAYIERPFGGGVVGAAQTIALTGSWAQYSLTFDVNGSGASWLSFSWAGAGGAISDSFDLDDVEVIPLGALSLPSVQPIPVLDDTTVLGGNQARTTGMIPVTTKTTWNIVTRTNTSGNQQLLGGGVFDLINRHQINTWSVFNAGTSVTVSLGNVSGGAQYANAVAISAGMNDVTPLARFNATNNLWVNSSGTSDLIHTISGQVIGNN